MNLKLTIILILFSLMPVLHSEAQAQADENAWIPADPAIECAGAKEPSLCAELLAMLDRDQLTRRKLVVGQDNPALTAELARIDKTNQDRLMQIITEYGWPTDALVGTRAGGAAWTIIQHADLPLQKQYLPLMQKAADEGHIEKALLAYTIDRVRLGDGKPQLYGTQFREVDGRFVMEPIEDEANVDQRRQAVGLPPLADYVELMKQFYDTQPVETPSPTQTESE